MEIDRRNIGDIILQPTIDKLAELIKQHGSIEAYCSYITDGQTDRRF